MKLPNIGRGLKRSCRVLDDNRVKDNIIIPVDGERKTILHCQRFDLYNEKARQCSVTDGLLLSLFSICGKINIDIS